MAKAAPVEIYVTKRVSLIIVAYVYDEATAFYQALHKEAESNKDFIQRERTVRIKLRPNDRRLPLAIDNELSAVIFNHAFYIEKRG